MMIEKHAKQVKKKLTQLVPELSTFVGHACALLSPQR